ncbi:MAG: CRISPR-associated endonuclease Cas2 [Candidatus Micrarchaeia archaeon]
MGMKETRYLFVAYDVKDDALRTKIANMLIYYGLTRIQYSVFKGEIRGDDKEKILKCLREIGLSVDDKVHVIELCEHCRKGVIVFGEDITVPQHFVV